MSSFKLFRWVGKFISLEALRKVFDFINHYVIGLYKRMDENHLFLSGAGIAYSLIISLIPFILLALSILGSIINPETVEQQITKAIDTIIPYPEYAKFIKNSILKRIPVVIEYKTLSGYLGGFGLFFTSTWLFSSIRTVLNKIFNCHEEKGALHGFLKDFGMVLLLIVFIALSTFILPTINLMFEFARRIEVLGFLRISDFTDIILSLVSVTIIFSMFFTFYKLIPYAKLGKRIPLVSAFWATLLWEVARRIFGYYVYEFLLASNLYGAFIILAVVIFWLFYSSCLFILGAEIGQLYREKREAKESKTA